MATQTQSKSREASKARRGTKAAANRAGSTALKQTVEQLQGIVPLGAKFAGSLPIKTAVARLAGARPSRTRAFLAASAAAVAGGVFAYRVLRSGD
jgi:hypothetical protein